MGGSAAMDWLGALGASFDAALAREEDEAAADLAFSLRQDTTVAESLARSGTGWCAVVDGETSLRVDEVGADYALAGAVLLPLERVALRSAPAPAPRTTERTLSEVLGVACRAQTAVEVITRSGVAAGLLVRATRDHLALRRGEAEVVVGLGAVEGVRIAGRNCYSDSRGFSG